ncbi:PcfJ domain-containing protein [Leifsonia sp. Leaf264]|uniref:PcfJ domain-containing protein n=1 Tax=Leifsonia sp. Leaf264 TaxID=1736314 RepID=UPI0007019B41|nr:PcfJ domain-containing protein [Leifsonia sp. Leaf264]KQO98503.1 hypothetical protein ASF30_10600 [Leifsonia sp. Leaf264]
MPTAPATIALPAQHWVDRHTVIPERGIIIEKFDTVTFTESQTRTRPLKDGREVSYWYYGARTFFSAKPTKSGERLLRIRSRSAATRNKPSVMTESWEQTRHLLDNDRTFPPELLEAATRMLHRTTGVPEGHETMKKSELFRAVAHPYLLELAKAGQDGILTGPRHRHIPARALRAKTAAEFTTATFGVRRTRKDLVKAVAAANMFDVQIAREAAKHVEVDWLVEFLRASVATPTDWAKVRKFGWGGERELPSFGKLFALVPPQRRRRLLMLIPGITKDGFRWIEDAVYSYKTLTDAAGTEAWTTTPPPAVAQAKTWRELHDALASTVRRFRNMNLPIPSHPVTDAVDGIRAAGHIIEAARETDQLLDWGDQMQHCIASYRSQAISGHTYLLAVTNEETGGLLANIELSTDGKVRQFYGRFNARPDAEITDPVTVAVERAAQQVLAQQKMLEAA